MIRVSVESHDRAIVCCEPEWWERLLLRTAYDRVAVAFPNPRGVRQWYFEATGRPVPEAVRAEIRNEMHRYEWRRYVAKRGNP